MDLVEETVANRREEELDDDALIQKTNLDEVQTVTRSLKPRKSLGPDQILNKALENLSEEAIVALITKYY